MVKRFEDAKAVIVALKSKGISAMAATDSLAKVFLGVGHGWTMRYNDEDESAVKSSQEDQDDMFNWFNKYV
ncbi:hypothetical protein V6N13_014130 [Hibiscus sabdariffa]|uniref:Uncharacterized protein n=1 Tax=Hibiscus sabdariffa TaxID=183260 RepID=A0ABR2RUB7_9ROSI